MYKIGHTLMIYGDLESNVIEFLRYIPLEYYPKDKDRELIYSPKLANILISIGSQIDTFFRNWILVQANCHAYSDKEIKKLNFMNYRSVENDVYLSNKKLTISTEIIITPFDHWCNWKQNKNDPSRDTRCWWNAYNHIKHNSFFYRREGNMNNVIKSLGALFILNCEHEEVWKHLIGRGYIDKPYINPDHQIGKNIDTTPFYVYHADAVSRLFRLKTRMQVTKKDYFGMEF